MIHVPKKQIDLGLAISRATCPPGVCRTQQEIADYCGCRRSTIWDIESRAIRKLRRALFKRRDPLLMELVEGIINRNPNPRPVSTGAQS